MYGGSCWYCCCCCCRCLHSIVDRSNEKQNKKTSKIKTISIGTQYQMRRIYHTYFCISCTHSIYARQQIRSFNVHTGGRGTFESLFSFMNRIENKTREKFNIFNWSHKNMHTPIIWILSIWCSGSIANKCSICVTVWLAVNFIQCR